MKTILAALLLTVSLGAQTPEPSQVFGVCGGVHGLSPVKAYGCYFVSQHIGTGTYTTQITDIVKMPDGTLGTSARLELTKTLANFGGFFLGISAGAGVAEGSNGSASTALAARPLVGWRIPRTPLALVGAAQLLNVAGSGQQANVSFAITWSQ